MPKARASTYYRSLILPSYFLLALLLLGFDTECASASASSFSSKDLLIFAKAVAFMEPPPDGSGTVAIVYAAGDAASKQDAVDIAAGFGGGLKAGSATLQAKVVTAAELGAAGPLMAIIVAAGGMSDGVTTYERAQHVVCASADPTPVSAGTCVMTVKSVPKIEIGVSKAGAASAGVKFQSAFLMMAHEQ